MAILKENILEVLLKSKRLTKESLDEALEIQREKQVPLRKILVEQNLISEEELLTLLSKQLYIPTIHLTKYKFDSEIIKLIPEYLARQYTLIPLSRIGNTLTIAISDPLNIFALDDLKTLTGFNIDTVLSPQEEITRAISAHYRPDAVAVQDMFDSASEGMEDADANLELYKIDQIELTSAIKASEDPPIVKLVDLMLTQALKKRASDIHVEPEKDCLRIRYRIDGALHDFINIPSRHQNAILARLKIISNLDITESRIPQDGRFKVKFEAKEIDFRVSALPTTFGQKFVLRALDKANLSVGLDNLGFSEQPLYVFKQAITKPFGMILVTGPTGSGKSTTLYSIITQLNTPERHIVTIEDPVEYQIEGITQIQVKPDIGLDFSSGLRSILRQSPDVIMIGEIRDSETADIAIKASLTGQLVLSTLHTNDAISSITRIIDMGVEPFLVASSVVMVCAQRLCRRICLKCRKPVEIPKKFLDEIGFHDSASFFQAQGCKYCDNTGYFGRIALLEGILIDDTLREMIIKKQSLDDLRAYAQKRGMRMLRDDAFLKVKEGTTTLDEALRITTEE
ncbi:MAG: Flp pilus assembly complex ATPase component TadA [Candidatus Omnitrophica bacterium]|nr:Flp pilus assembly complex ATPase component TadA [Candidatus Omnitrophota bacterium]